MIERVMWRAAYHRRPHSARILVMLAAFIFPVIAGHVIVNKQFAAAFRVGEWWAIFRANFAGFLLSFILIMGTTIFLSYGLQLLYATIILCCLIPILGAMLWVYMGVVGSALFGQAYRIGAEKLDKIIEAG